MGKRGGGEKESTKFFENLAKPVEPGERTRAIAKQVVKKILSDLSGRKGLGDEWDSIDEEIQEEIAETWEAIVLAVLA